MQKINVSYATMKSLADAAVGGWYIFYYTSDGIFQAVLAISTSPMIVVFTGDVEPNSFNADFPVRFQMEIGI